MLPKNIDFDFKLVYHLVSLIPKGKVLTYGKVAEILSIKSPRLKSFFKICIFLKKGV
jgi:alkylated DNA nucleotide flippase Atl1